MSIKALKKAAPWVFPAGVELTWQPKKYQERDASGMLHEELCALSLLFDAFARQEGLKPAKTHEEDWGKHTLTHNDCTHCVEYPTPILHSYKKLERVYDQATKIARKLDMRPSVEGATTGMGHIHTGGLSRDEKMWAMRDMIHRPYVTWALVHPSDDINARPLAGALADEGPNNFVGHNTRVGAMWKRYALRHNIGYDTLEWRAFDAPENLDEQVRQMALVQRYFAWVREQVKTGKPIPDFPFSFKRGVATRWLQGWDFQQSAEAWQGFIEGLGLPYEEYSYWVDQNMEPRFEWGNRV